MTNQTMPSPDHSPKPVTMPPDTSENSASGYIKLCLYNAIVLAIFCGAWYGGFYISEYWMHIIDLGAPWSWHVVLFIVSYAASAFALRKHSMVVVESFSGPVITALMFYFWVGFCAIKFDPFY
jgi:hypothetical protein